MVSPKASDITVGNSTTSSSQTFSLHGPLLSSSGSSWISRKTWGGTSQLSNTTSTSSISSSIATSLPFQAARPANISQASLSLSRSLSSSSYPTSSNALSTAATLTFLNPSATTITALTVGMMSQTALSRSVATPLSAGTTGAGPLIGYSESITTIITSPPLAFFTSTSSNSDWTKDTTTLINGTIRPVLVGCNFCGGPHHGIVVAGLGREPTDPPRTGCGPGLLFGSSFGCGSEFDFPLLPPFMIGIDGTPLDESSGDDDGSSSEFEDEDHCSLPKSDGRTMQTSSPSLPPTSTVPSSSSSSTSSLASSKPSEYLVFPKTGTSADGFSALTRFFDDELGADNALQVSLNDAGDQVMYIIYTNEWFAQNPPLINPKVCIYFNEFQCYNASE